MRHSSLFGIIRFAASEFARVQSVSDPSSLVLSGAAIAVIQQQGSADSAWLPIAGAVIPLIGLFVLIVRNMSDQHFEQFKEYKTENKELSKRLNVLEDEKEQAEDKVKKLNAKHQEDMEAINAKHQGDIEAINAKHVQDITKAINEALQENNRKHNIEIDNLKKENNAAIELRVAEAVKAAVEPLQIQIKFYQDREVGYKDERTKLTNDMNELTEKYNDLNERFNLMQKENDNLKLSVVKIKNDTDKLVPPPEGG